MSESTIPTVIGETNFRNRRQAFGIKRDDRRRHVYVVGKTGVGKSTLLANMIIQDIQRGEGLAVVDPHGELAEGMLDFIPPERINDVVFFDPSDADFPIAFNVLETVGTEDPRFDQEKNLVSSGLVGVFKKLWADSWGPRLEYILRNTILALIDTPGNTLLGIMRMLVDKGFRRKIVERIRDPVVKSFWVDEFAQYNERFRNEAISPIQNKVGQFLSSSIIRNIVGQPTSTIDLREVMNEGKIFIMNLSKGKIGEDNAALLGAMMITKIQLAAMDRARLAEEERRDFYLYVDEFQNFATESFAAILSEARKYRLDIIMAHQYITQMSEEVRDAVFGNVGTMVTFRVGAFDAEFLEREYAPYFTETDLVNLDKYNAYIKLMIDGTASKPFSMTTIPMGAGFPLHNEREKAVRVSRERYGRSKEDVEGKIAKWSATAFRQAAEEESAAFEGRMAPRPERRRAPAERGGPPRGGVRLPAVPRTATQAGLPGEALPAGRPVPRSPEGEVGSLGEGWAKPGPAEPALEELEDVVVSAPQQASLTNLDQLLSGAEEGRRLKRGYPTTCDRCGRATEVPFEPTPGKEKYCRECLTMVRQERRQPARRSFSEGGLPVGQAPLRPPGFPLRPPGYAGQAAGQARGGSIAAPPSREPRVAPPPPPPVRGSETPSDDDWVDPEQI